MLRKMLCLTTLSAVSVGGLGAFTGSAHASTAEPLTLVGTTVEVVTSGNNLRQISLAGLSATGATYRVRWDVTISG